MTIHAAMLLLNTDNKQAQRDLAHRNEMHKTVMCLLPDNMGASPREQANLLWRTDERDGYTQLFVQSTMDLNMDNLPDGYTVTENQLDYSRVLDAVAQGTEVTYRIAANPTSVHTHVGDNKTTKRRVPLCDDLADEWWDNRAALAGLMLGTFESSPEDAKTFGKGRATLNVVNFSGAATVTNIDEFRQAVRVGIGRGKSYGTGLLLAVPSARMP